MAMAFVLLLPVVVAALLIFVTTQSKSKAPGTSWKRYSMPRSEVKERRKKAPSTSKQVTRAYVSAVEPPTPPHLTQSVPTPPVREPKKL
jgi:hypothetical protein